MKRTERPPPCRLRGGRRGPAYDAPALGPELPDPGPDYAELFSEGAFAHRPLISGKDLRAEAEARGLALPLLDGRSVLEPLDREGVFSPVGFLQANYTPETTWLEPDPGLVHWREERHFEPWEAHGWPARHGRRHVSERFSPWQLLYLDEAMGSLHITLPVTEVLREGGPAPAYRGALEARRAHFGALDASWRPLVKLLAALQPRLWPARSGRTVRLHRPTASGLEPVFAADHALERFDAASVLRRFALTAGGVAQLHLGLAEAGLRLDPLGCWYRISSRAPRARSDGLRGAALRARDLYDAAFLLRGLYHLVTGRWLPEPDDLDGPRSPEGFLTVAGRRRRHLPHAGEDRGGRQTRLDLKGTLIREGLYPHLIHFFVEGETEKIVISELLGFLGYDLAAGSMSVTNFGGIDKAARYDALLTSISRFAARTVLIADREGEIERTIARLREAGALVDAQDVVLWEAGGKPSSFEEANFSSGELLAAIAAAGKRRDAGVILRLSPEDLDAEVARLRLDAAKEGRPPPAKARVALRLAGQEAHGSVAVGKAAYAPDLARILKRDIEETGYLEDAGRNRPLLVALWRWIADGEGPRSRMS